MLVLENYVRQFHRIVGMIKKGWKLLKNTTMWNMTKPQSTGLKECKMEYAFVPTKSPDVLLEFVVAELSYIAFNEFKFRKAWVLILGTIIHQLWQNEQDSFFLLTSFLNLDSLIKMLSNILWNEEEFGKSYTFHFFWHTKP